MKKFYFASIFVAMCCLLPVLVSCEDEPTVKDEFDLFMENYPGTWESSEGVFSITMTAYSAEIIDGDESYSLMAGVSFPVSGDVTLVYETFLKDVIYSIHLERMVVPNEMDVTITVYKNSEQGETTSTKRRFTLRKVS